MVAVPPAVDGHVHYRQRPGVALLYRPVLAARLRKLYAWGRHAANSPGNLDRPSLSRFPQGALVGETADRMRQLRPALEPVAGLTRRHLGQHPRRGAKDRG